MRTRRPLPCPSCSTDLAALAVTRIEGDEQTLRVRCPSCRRNYVKRRPLPY